MNISALKFNVSCKISYESVTNSEKNGSELQERIKRDKSSKGSSRWKNGTLEGSTCFRLNDGNTVLSEGRRRPHYRVQVKLGRSRNAFTQEQESEIV
jgi:hypothetical protein